MRGEIHTNTVEGAFSLFNRAVIGIFHHVSAKHLQRYCNEFAFKYNSRKWGEGQRFEFAMTQVAGRLRYNQLVNSPDVPPR